MALDVARQKTISAFVDGELSVEAMLEVEQWARDDEAVRREIESLKMLRNRVAEVCQGELPPELEKNLRNRIRAVASVEIARQEGRRAPVTRGVSWSWTAAVAILVLALALPKILTGPPDNAGFLAQAEKYHTMLVDVGEPEIPDDNVVLATHKLNNQLKTSYSDRALSQSSGQFKGWCNMRLVGIQDSRRFAFDVDGTPVSLYFLRSSADLPCALLHKEIRTGERLYLGGRCGPYQVVKWQQGDVSIIVIGDLPTKRLAEFLDELKF